MYIYAVKKAVKGKLEPSVILNSWYTPGLRDDECRVLNKHFVSF